MPRSAAWDRLYRAAEAQAGLFATDQAEACGYAAQHLQKHLTAGRIIRVRRGIYRLAQFPVCELEELVALWRWSGREGVFSHETSLLLHELSDALPAKVHTTVPAAWRTRRTRVQSSRRWRVYAKLAEPRGLARGLATSRWVLWHSRDGVRRHESRCDAGPPCRHRR